jgi:hypothetical protein|tara:strand:- start:22020 stop:23471 length:1452 start_codon:yes stop_codon:yes gene_type:complete
MAENFNPSGVEIEKAELISYDGKTRTDIGSGNYIYGWSISQSMNAVAYSGTIDILDTSGILEGMPIRGEESLNLWLVGLDMQTQVKISARIHKVSDIKPKSNSGGATYTLHFISKQTFKASTKSITRSYLNRPSEMAREIFDDNFASLDAGTKFDSELSKIPLPYNATSYNIIKEGDTRNEPLRSFVVQPTDNKAQIIVPDLSPTEAMFFVASRSLSSESTSQSYKFFETIENYYYCTDEYFIKKANEKSGDILNLFFAPVVDLDATNVKAQINRIEDFQVMSKGIDTSTDIYSGAYRSEVVEIDFVHRRLTYNKFNYDTDAKYIDMNAKVRSLDENPHTAEFRKDTFTEANAKRFMIFKDFASKGEPTSNIQGDMRLTDIVHNRISYYHHLNNTQVVANMKGRLDIRPGMIVNVDIKALDSVDATMTLNESLSGKYLVQSTSHTMSEGTLYCGMKMAKFDWSGQTQLAPNETTDIADRGNRI